MELIDKAQDCDQKLRQNQLRLINIICETNKDARDQLYYLKEREEEQIAAIPSTQVAEKIMKTFLEVSNPTSTFRIIWELISMLFIFVQMIYIPMALSFSIDSNLGMDTLNNAMDIFFVIDLLLNFKLAYYHNGKLEYRYKKIALNYFKFWFWIDLVAILPYDLMVGVESGQSTQILKIVRLFKFIKIVRLLRVLKLGRILIKIEGTASDNLLETFSIEQTLQAVIQFLKITVMILSIAHWIACIMNIIEYLDEQVEETWMYQYGIYDAPWEVKYITALYFSITTMITVGYGDISQHTHLEMVFGIIVMVISSGIFGYSMSSLMFIIQGEDQNLAEVKNQNSKILKYIKQKCIPKQLQNRVKNYLEWLEGSAQIAKNSESVILNNLSANLHTEIITLLHSRILKQVNLISREFSPQLRNKIVYILKEHLLGPEEYIFKENQVDSHLLYFIQNGQVSICLTKKEISLIELGKGDSFGEISFFSKCPRTASAKTLDFVNLKSLSRKDLWDCAHDLNADLEKLFYIKDCVEMGNSLKPLKIRCYICDRPHHIARNCTIMHYRARRLKIIENYLKEKNERCSTFIRRAGKSMISAQMINIKSDPIFRYRFLNTRSPTKSSPPLETQLSSTKDTFLFFSNVDDVYLHLDKYKDYSEFYPESNPVVVLRQINQISEQKLQEIKEEKEEIANRFRQNWMNSRKLKQLQLMPPRQSKSSYDNILIETRKQSNDINQIIFSEESSSFYSSQGIKKMRGTKGKRLLELQTQKQQQVKRSTSRSKMEMLFQNKQNSLELKPNKIERQKSLNINQRVPQEIAQFKGTNLSSLIQKKQLIYN